MLKDSKNKYNDTLLEVAMERNELVHFITGIGIYEIVAPQGMNVGMDYSYKQVIDTLYRNINRYESFPTKIENSFSTIFNNFKSDLIVRALKALNYHMLCEKKGIATFNINNIELLQKARNNISKNKELFKNGEYPFWEEIEDVDKYINDSHGIHIL